MTTTRHGGGGGRGRGLALARSVALAGWRALVDVLLPPRCLACGCVVGRGGALCPGCWSGLSFLAPPQCLVCGYPFEVDEGEDAICGSCLRRRPAYDHARAALVYDDASRPLVLDLKHGDRLEGVPALALWLAQAAGPLLTSGAVVVPVPLHRLRLLRRRYNQSALLAGALARHAGLRYLPDSLQRRRNTPSQGRLSAGQRRRNVANAFAVPPRRQASVSGRQVLLVDDVHTTGATLEACARALKRAGAQQVVALTLARVVRPRL